MSPPRKVARARVGSLTLAQREAAVAYLLTIPATAVAGEVDKLLRAGRIGAGEAAGLRDIVAYRRGLVKS